ncbi:MAG: Connector [Bacteriophage sp.]|nr:MAG: Connector [Bacteriophage sp.]
MFKWEGLPESVDVRYLEMELFLTGQALFFKDDVLGYLVLGCLANGSFDVYGEPKVRRAYSRYSGYNSDSFTDKNSVIIWNNYMRVPSAQDVMYYAQRLWDLDSTIDINARAQKTPVLIQCDEKQKLSLLNVYKEYDGNSPVLFGDKNLDIKGFGVLKTDAPFVADKLYELKNQIWNEALTYLGISNVSYQKRERLITDEVARSQGGTVASRYSRLAMREQACDRINEMFGLDVSVKYREDFQIPDVNDEVDSEGGEADE